MISLQEAQSLVARAARQLDVVQIGTRDALGLVLAREVVAGEAVPPFANTAMDGYAVIAADTLGATEANPASLVVVGELPAGTAPDRAVERGEAIRIMTGAPMPPGADAVVMVERTVRDDDRGAVWVSLEVAHGEHVRGAGGDVGVGAVVFSAGTQLRAAHLGVLASLDVQTVSVVRRARVGVLSTGDEVVASGPLSPGKIRDSNRPMLLAMVHEAGCEAVDLGIAADDEAAIFDLIADAMLRCDVLLTSGAVSVGDYDFVKTAIERLAATRGGQYNWQQVAIKPAKPLAFATIHNGDRDVAIFGLPGNPVSSHVSFEVFARPVLRAMMGHDLHAARPEVLCTAARAMPRRADGKVHLDRVHVWIADGVFMCERSGEQASNVLSGMANASGLAVMADGVGVDVGGLVRVMLLTDL
jgi:molybdopterin molybdotransferase